MQEEKGIKRLKSIKSLIDLEWCDSIVKYTYLHSRENLAKDFNFYFFFLQNKQYVSIIIQCKRLRNSLLNTEKYCHETWKYLNHLFI